MQKLLKSVKANDCQTETVVKIIYEMMEVYGLKKECLIAIASDSCNGAKSITDRIANETGCAIVRCASHLLHDVI